MRDDDFILLHGSIKKSCRVQKGKEVNDFQRNPLDIEILSNLMFGSLEIRDTSVFYFSYESNEQFLENLIGPGRPA